MIKLTFILIVLMLSSANASAQVSREAAISSFVQGNLSYKEGDFDSVVCYCDEAILLGYVAPQGYLNALAPYRD